MADVPHFAFPLQRGAGGHLATVEQDSLDDIEARVLAVVYTHEGQIDGLAEFGHPDWTFLEQPIGAEEIADEILRSVPAADLIVEEAPDRFAELVDRVSITIQGST